MFASTSSATSILAGTPQGLPFLFFFDQSTCRTTFLLSAAEALAQEAFFHSFISLFPISYFLFLLFEVGELVEQSFYKVSKAHLQSFFRKSCMFWIELVEAVK